MTLKTILLLLLLPAAAAAESAAVGLYNQANALYQEGRFDEARHHYRQAAAAGVHDGRLCYNLGNACFKAGDLGLAIVWYERALRLAPRDEDALANLRYANALKQDREPEESNLAWRLFSGVFFWTSMDELCTSLGLLALLLFGLAVRQLRSDAPVSGGTLIALTACVTVLTLNGMLLGGRIYHRATVTEAVVVVAEDTARSGPDAAQTTVFVVHEGTKVRVVRAAGSWRLVRLANGLGGWLPENALTVI